MELELDVSNGIPGMHLIPRKENINTEELQEAIHIYRSGIQIPETGAEITDERLIELIQLWRESSGN